MKTQDEIKREKTKKQLDGLSESNKAAIIANMRKKGFSCNTEDEIITAYQSVYSGSNLLLSVFGLAFVMWIIYTLITL